MPVLIIRAKGATFVSSDSGAEYEKPEDALAVGIQGGLVMLADEINAGRSNAAIELSIETEDGTQILCSVISAAVSAIIPRDAATDVS